MGESFHLAARVGELLQARGWTCATAESCTGGLVGHYLTNISGSSSYLLGGLIAYADRIKIDLLGVPQSVLTAHGAVSTQVAVAMAQGARRLLSTDLAVSVTGIAGPLGGTPAKPIGTVYIAVSSPLGDMVRHFQWGEDREGNKRLSAEAALNLVIEQLEAPLE